MPNAATTPTERLLPLAEYQKLASSAQPTELVCGKVVPLRPPFPWHGFVCGRVDQIVGRFICDHDLGYAVINNSGVLTQRNPDSLRGADFAFYSYERVPKGMMLKLGYLTVAPELVIEVREPDDPWQEVWGKFGEFLKAGVRVICDLDPQRRTATLYQTSEPEVTLQAEEELTLPRLLPGFTTKVARFFE
jgi:Uma2 family endonuclease